MRLNFTRALQASPLGVLLRWVWEGPQGGPPAGNGVRCPLSRPSSGLHASTSQEGALTARAPRLQGGVICALTVGCKHTGRWHVAPEPAYYRSEARQAPVHGQAVPEPLSHCTATSALFFS